MTVDTAKHQKFRTEKKILHLSASMKREAKLYTGLPEHQLLMLTNQSAAGASEDFLPKKHSLREPPHAFGSLVAMKLGTVQVC